MSFFCWAHAPMNIRSSAVFIVIKKPNNVLAISKWLEHAGTGIIFAPFDECSKLTALLLSHFYFFFFIFYCRRYYIIIYKCWHPITLSGCLYVLKKNGVCIIYKDNNVGTANCNVRDVSCIVNAHGVFQKLSAKEGTEGIHIVNTRNHYEKNKKNK